MAYSVFCCYYHEYAFAGLRRPLKLRSELQTSLNI